MIFLIFHGLDGWVTSPNNVPRNIFRSQNRSPLGGGVRYSTSYFFPFFSRLPGTLFFWRWGEPWSSGSASRLFFLAAEGCTPSPHWVLQKGSSPFVLPSHCLSAYFCASSDFRAVCPSLGVSIRVFMQLSFSKTTDFPPLFLVCIVSSAN